MPLKRRVIDKLYELCLEAELEQDANQIVRIVNVIANFPESMIEIAGCYDENSNDESIGVAHTLTKQGEWKDIYVKGPYPHKSLWASLSANFTDLGVGPVFQITKGV